MVPSSLLFVSAIKQRNNAAMKTHDVQSIEIKQAPKQVFEYVANPCNLPKWTDAFSSADSATAIMRTPNGELAIKLRTDVNEKSRTIDWHMTMPDKSLGRAFSRVTEGRDGSSVYSFVLMSPPVPLEMLEGALQTQVQTLRRELSKLKTILEAHDYS